LPKPLIRLKSLLQGGLRETAPLWPDIRLAYRWVQRAASLLQNADQHAGAAVKRRFQGLLGAMAQHRAAAGALAPATAHFLKVTRSYWPGLFHCYAVPELPRTNNDLEQCFGAYGYHERRATGRKVASPALVLSGSVALVASTITRGRTFSPAELAPANRDTWMSLRAGLEARRRQRTLRGRFRRDPMTYLTQLEDKLLKLTLPP
jgi:hypothetical protein